MDIVKIEIKKETIEEFKKIAEKISLSNKFSYKEGNQYTTKDGEIFYKHPNFPILINTNGTRYFNCNTGNFCKVIADYKNKMKKPKEIRNVVVFSMNGCSYKKKAHTLVWESINNKTLPKNQEIHHIDSNRNNNHITNLCNCTRKQHVILHRLKKGLPILELERISGDTVRLTRGVYFNEDNNMIIINRKPYDMDTISCP